MDKDDVYIPVPSTGLTSPTSWGSRDQIKKMIEKIWTNYGKFFQFASLNSKIPAQMLVSFCAVESGGNPTAGSSGHITQGLMQWNRTYAKSQLESELKQNRLSPDEKSKLASFGIKFDSNGKTREITNADQLKPELNILIGSIVLGQLVDTDWGKEVDIKKATEYAKQLFIDNASKGIVITEMEAIEQAKKKFMTLRLDRVISVYNAGAYGDTGKKARTGNYTTPKDLASAVNDTTANYIKKIMGKNGALDIAVTDLPHLFA